MFFNYHVPIANAGDTTIVLFLFFFAVDITVYRNGYHGDLNETFFVGEVDEGAKRLVQTTYECLMQAIDAGKGFLALVLPCLFVL